MAYTLQFLGDQAGARRHIERMLAGYRPLERQTHAFRFQFDQRVIGRMTLALVQWVQGEPEAAMACVEDNVRDALTIGHPLTLCNALIKACCPVALLCGRTDLAQHYVELLLQHTSAHPLFMWHPVGRCYQGLLRLAQGDLDGGRQAVRQALDELPQARFAFPQTWVRFGTGAGRCAVRRRRAGPGDHRAGHRTGAPRRRALVPARAAARARRGPAAAR